MSDPELERILSVAERLPFVVLVTWLERLLEGEAAIGQRGPYRAEPVRFRHDSSLGFHSHDLKQIKLVERPGGASIVELTTSFAGLTGSASPLPPSFIERLCRDDDDESAVQRDFLDLFHHRLLGLFYRGLLKFDLPRSTTASGTGKALDWVLLLAGFDPHNAERLTGLTRGQLLALAPLLVTYPANAQRLEVALRCLLEESLEGAAIQIRELQGGFVFIEPSARSTLGVDMRLGHNSTLGRRAPSPASEIGIELAPLSPEACRRLSPGGDEFPLLEAVARLFTPETVRVAVALLPTHTPPSRLGRSGARAGVQLGRDAWLTARGRPTPICFALDARENRHAS